MSIIIEPQKQPELMHRLRLLSLAQALHMEVKHGMKLARGVNGLQIAKQQFGYQGNRKVGALHYVLKLMRENGQELSPTLAKWEEENPA